MTPFILTHKYIVAQCKHYYKVSIMIQCVHYGSLSTFMTVSTWHWVHIITEYIMTYKLHWHIPYSVPHTIHYETVSPLRSSVYIMAHWIDYDTVSMYSKRGITRLSICVVNPSNSDVSVTPTIIISQWKDGPSPEKETQKFSNSTTLWPQRKLLGLRCNTKLTLWLIHKLYTL